MTRLEKARLSYTASAEQRELPAEPTAEVRNLSVTQIARLLD
jgi:hypothetical protein